MRQSQLKFRVFGHYLSHHYLVPKSNEKIVAKKMEMEFTLDLAPLFFLRRFYNILHIAVMSE
jgi:hypothetical protein